MAEILQCIYSGKLTVCELLKQLNEVSASKDGKNLAEFVPFFLNYIRDSCSWTLDNQLNSTNANPLPDNESSVLKIADVKQTKDVKPYKDVENVPLRTIRTVKEYPTSNSSSPVVIGCTPYRKSNRKNVETSRRKIKKNVVPNEGITLDSVAPDINDVMVFPPIGVESSRTKPVRRINPTHIKPNRLPVQPTLCEDLFVKTNDVFNQSPFQDRDDVSLERERTLLKEAKGKLQQTCSVAVSTKPLENLKQPTILPSDVVKISPVAPDPLAVTMKKKLLVVIELYDTFISEGFVPNVTSELYFVFQLITSNIKSIEERNKNGTPFCSIHNCVYFAVSILEKQKPLLCLLDSRTLKSLTEIPVLSTFSPSLIQYLQQCIENRGTIHKKKESNIGEVAYRADTDTRKNFPTDQSFASFSKQRDLFYDILYAWQDNNSLVDMYFDKWFAKNTRQLVDMGSEMVNHFHLAKLICSQMLISCLNGEEMAEIPAFYNSSDSRDKLAKLNERLSAQKGNPCPLPDFPGMQAFFESFLKITTSSSLSTYLVDIMKSHLLEINNCDFAHEMENCSLTEAKEKFQSMLMESRLLAKFLGCVTFMPYKSTKAFSKHIVDELVKFRADIKPQLDCIEILQAAEKKGQLLLTIPWMVEYLSMIDQVGMQLKETKQVYTKLAEIYHGRQKHCMTSLNFNFLRIIIGWLFENQNVPNVFCCTSEILGVDDSSRLSSLDMQDIIDINVIYSCCSYLQELRSLVEDYINCVPRKAPVRKITPLPMSQTNIILTDERKLEYEMEEYFFFLQPKVMKKIVEFTAERVASNLIHKINVELDISKDKYAERLGNKLSHLSIKSNKDQIHEAVELECVNLCDEVKKWALGFIFKECMPSVKKVFDVNAGEQFDPGVVDIGSKISTRIALERLLPWVESNITVESVRVDLRLKVKQLIKKKQLLWDCDDFPFDGNWEGRSSTQLLTYLHNSLSDIRQSDESFSMAELIDVCKEITSAFEKKYFSDYLKAFVLLTINVMVSIIVHLPEQCSDSFVAIMINLWKKCPLQFINLRNISSAGFVHYVEHCSQNRDLSLQKMSFLIKSLLDAGLIEQEDLNRNAAGLEQLNCELKSNSGA